MGFTPIVQNCNAPFLNPKIAKVFQMSFKDSRSSAVSPFILTGSNIVQGFSRLGYRTIGAAAVEWFNTSTDTGSVLAQPFDAFFYAGNTWSLSRQLSFLFDQLGSLRDQPVFAFLNVGETHVPYWYEGAPWDRWPSPCIPFGGDACSFEQSRLRQRECLRWVDTQLKPLIERFSHATILLCSDHGDCWGEDGLWEHGVSHSATLTVPLILRLNGVPIG